MAQNTFFQQLRILHLAITVMGAATVGVFAFLSTQIPPAINTEDAQKFQYIGAIVGILLAFFGRFVYAQMLKKIDDNAPLETRISLYRAAFLVKMALLESGVLAVTVFFFLTGLYPLLFIAVAMVVLLFLQSPSVVQISEELELTPQERATL